MNYFVVVFILFGLLINAVAARNSIVMTMMLRDEAVNIRANLPLWIEKIDYFVFMVDYRTIDDTVSAIAEVLSGKRDYQNLSYSFEGFGPARTESLEAAWKYFPQATHVWIADPDWRPQLDTINVNDLNLYADAFRFMIYDRNGFSTRQCDWLLRHREGLKMKYHLHEVLDVGAHYQHMKVGWVVNEIEKAGTWHATVGHGNSMSATRYLFDLSMLYKDLEIYPHDPHTDYYLGVTHEAYASQLIADGHPHDELVEYHIHLAIKYMELRIRSVYDDEFLEQRWGVLLELGQTYETFRGDLVSSAYWLSMGRDFSLKQVDCAMSLVRLYLHMGNLREATIELKRILATKTEDRIMMNHFRLLSCDLPMYGLEMFGLNYVTYPQDISSTNFNDLNHAKLSLVLLYMARREPCVGFQAYNLTLEGALYDYFSRGFAAYDLKIPSTPSALEAQANDFCMDPSFTAFLKAEGYQIHICEEFRTQQRDAEMCMAFHTYLPAPFEDYQISNFKEFLGAASLPDILHHAFGGDTSIFLPPGMLVYRILFAQHFNPNLIYALIGSMLFPAQQTIQVALEIVIVASLERQLQIDTHIKYCLPNLERNQNVIITYVREKESEESSVGDVENGSFFGGTESEAMSLMRRYRNYFNYIEYCGPTGTVDSVLLDIKQLKTLLHNGGIIGYTYFTKNVHSDNIRRMLANRNNGTFLPFSNEAHRLVKGYLTYTRDLAFYNTDEHLVRFLSEADNSNGTFPTLSIPDVEEMMQRAGMTINAWVPTAYSNPYEEIKHYNIKQFYDYGVSRDDLLHSTLVNFRRTAYVSDAQSPLGTAGRLGRVNFDKIAELTIMNVSEASFSKHYHDVARDIMIIDRSGYMSFLLASGKGNADKGMTMSLSFAAKSSPLLNMSMTMLPNILHGLSLVIQRPTLAAMFDANVDADRGNINSARDIIHVHRMMLDVLSFLESMNMLTVIWSDKDKFLQKYPQMKYLHTDDNQERYRAAFMTKPSNSNGDSSDSTSGNNDTGTIAATTLSESVIRHTDTLPQAQPKSHMSKGSSSARDYADKLLAKGNTKSFQFSDHKMSKGEQGVSLNPDANPPGGTNSFGGLQMSTKTAISSSAKSKAEINPGVDKPLSNVDAGADNRLLDLETKIAKLRKQGVPEALIQKARNKYLESKPHVDANGRAFSSGDSKMSSEGNMSGGPLGDTAAIITTIDTTVQLDGSSSGSVDSETALSSSVGSRETESLWLTSTRSKTSEENGRVPNKAATKTKKDQKSLKKKAKKRAVVPMVRQQTHSELLSSKRDPECAQRGKHVGQDHCIDTQSPDVNRFSAELTSVSLLKVQFDILQLRYIALQDKTSAQRIAHYILPKVQQINKALRTSRKYAIPNAKKQSFHMTAQEYASLAGGLYNRALHVAKDPVTSASKQLQILYPEAKTNIKASDMDLGSADYLVVDMAININTLRMMGNILLTSTIWFDVMNGQMFASHHDDGLVHGVFSAFCKEIADTLSNTVNYGVKKYFAVAMDLASEGQGYGPLFLAGKGELVVVTWVNSNASPTLNVEGDTDGLVVYDTLAAYAFSENIRIQPDVHPDVVIDVAEEHTNDFDKSIATDLNVELFESDISKEIIGRHNNRLVLVGPHRVFHFCSSSGNTTASRNYKEQLDRKAFDQRMMIALVIFLEESK